MKNKLLSLFFVLFAFVMVTSSFGCGQEDLQYYCSKCNDVTYQQLRDQGYSHSQISQAMAECRNNGYSCPNY